MTSSKTSQACDSPECNGNPSQSVQSKELKQAEKAARDQNKNSSSKESEEPAEEKRGGEYAMVKCLQLAYAREVLIFG
ncbi:hypothetical protein NHQ30_011328 [Ciborinia camelliae]|nr:hypothetical protein NHQ30_011328 [Ciborinia camelliae]